MAKLMSLMIEDNFGSQEIFNILVNLSKEHGSKKAGEITREWNVCPIEGGFIVESPDGKEYLVIDFFGKTTMRVA